MKNSNYEYNKYNITCNNIINLHNVIKENGLYFNEKINVINGSTHNTYIIKINCLTILKSIDDFVFLKKTLDMNHIYLSDLGILNKGKYLPKEIKIFIGRLLSDINLLKSGLIHRFFGVNKCEHDNYFLIENNFLEDNIKLPWDQSISESTNIKRLVDILEKGSDFAGTYVGHLIAENKNLSKIEILLHQLADLNQPDSPEMSNSIFSLVKYISDEKKKINSILDDLIDLGLNLKLEAAYMKINIEKGKIYSCKKETQNYIDLVERLSFIEYKKNGKQSI